MYCFIMYWPTDNSDILSLYKCLLLKSTSSKCFRWHVYCSNPHRQSVSVDMSTVKIHIVKVFLMTCLLLKSTSSKVFPLTCLLLKSTLSMCFHWHVYCWNPHCQSVSDDMSTVEIHIVKVFPLKSTLSMCFHWHVYCWNPHCQSASIDMSMVEIHKYQRASDDMSTVEIHIIKVFPLTCQRLKSTNIKVLLTTCLLVKSTRQSVSIDMSTLKSIFVKEFLITVGPYF